MPKYTFDALDRRIIAELQADARLTNVELAKKVGLSPSPCLRRVKRLEKAGVIEGYRGLLTRERVGLGMTVFISIKIEGHASEGADDFVSAVSAMAEVISFHLVSGETDYLLEVVVPDLAHYQRFLLDRLLNMPIVREVKSNFVIQTHKAGAPMPLDHLD
ncbi:Lrp/AsnC family transcriptional regulator [Bradyrhizobium sp.]|jgi:Lrp/AsnC family leucine-responsive transcriptional regulator|uniref:Lrp/AsnC family transcriptional regulator n=1 Tax=Bradyrhizobium sp. TaxID=376 RepID=UPI003C181637